ncbi:GH32 C-terminal domain-containing protein [Sphingobacterium siyangense]|uniref:GH32 C-terminal domain-containing protein n=1 Tax=Sphingobacterium siyangense TaxID=459529 RepID=UPI003DA1D605
MFFCSFIKKKVFKYNVSTEELLVDNVRAQVPLRNKKLALKLLVDRTGLELFAQNGEVYMPINYNFDRNNLTYELVAFNGEAVLESADLYALDSIWFK